MTSSDTIDFDRISDAHRALLDAHRNPRAKPKPLLADQAQNPSAWHKERGKRMVSNLQSQLGQYEVMVLDDDAARLVTRTAHTTPKQVAAMTELAVAPHDKLWVEMSYEAMEEVILEQTPWMHRRPTAPGERIAFVYENRDGVVVVRIVQNVDGDPKHVHEWPIAFIISNTGQPIDAHLIESWDDVEMVAQDLHGTGPVLAKIKGTSAGSKQQQTARIWGYEDSRRDLKKLYGLADLMILPAQSRLWKGYNMFELAQGCSRELTGLPRRAVAILALLNTTIVQAVERQRPPGRFMSNGGVAKPFVTRTTTVLSIPHRVRRVYEYVESEIRAEVSRIHKRRHAVVGHFRHLSYEPVNGHGWTPCFCPGREPGRYWHKFIREHERGDEALGRVEHDYRIVRGDQE